MYLIGEEIIPLRPISTSLDICADESANNDLNDSKDENVNSTKDTWLAAIIKEKVESTVKGLNTS
jgi:hypothetical protein